MTSDGRTAQVWFIELHLKCVRLFNYIVNGQLVMLYGITTPTSARWVGGSAENIRACVFNVIMDE